MYCKHCKTEIDHNATVCPNCGEAVAPAGIRLSCQNCGAVLTPDKNETIMTCPYCGSKHLFSESDEVKIARMKADTEKERLAAEKKQQEAGEIRKASEKYRKSFRKHWTVLCMIVCFVMALVSISAGYPAAAVVAFVQGGLFCLSWMLGTQIIPEKRPQLHRIPMFIAYALTIVFFLCWSGNIVDFDRNDPWPTGGLADRIPQPEGNYACEVSINDRTRLSIRVRNIDADGVNRYIDQCKEMGFSEDPELTETYRAIDADGYVLEVSQYSSIEKMSISLDSPVNMMAFSWTTNPDYAFVPAPESNTGVIEFEYRGMYQVMLGETDHSTYDAYVQKCLDAGFNQNYTRTRHSFTGYMETGHQIRIDYIGFDRMRIEVRLAKETE